MLWRKGGRVEEGGVIGCRAGEREAEVIGCEVRWLVSVSIFVLSCILTVHLILIGVPCMTGNITLCSAIQIFSCILF